MDEPNRTLRVFTLQVKWRGVGSGGAFERQRAISQLVFWFGAVMHWSSVVKAIVWRLADNDNCTELKEGYVLWTGTSGDGGSGGKEVIVVSGPAQNSACEFLLRVHKTADEAYRAQRGNGETAERGYGG